MIRLRKIEDTEGKARAHGRQLHFTDLAVRHGSYAEAAFWVGFKFRIALRSPGIEKGRFSMSGDSDHNRPRKQDPNIYYKPRQFSDAEVQNAVRHIKTKNPRLWSELVSLERQKVAIDAVWPALVRLLDETKLIDQPAELANLIMAVRRVAVAEADGQ